MTRSPAPRTTRGGTSQAPDTVLPDVPSRAGQALPGIFLLLIALAFPSTALAQASGRTTIGPLTYTLTDLDPSDGITPSLSFDALPFQPDPGGQVAYVAGLYEEGDVFFSTQTYGSGGTAPISQTLEPNNKVWISGTLSGRDHALSHRIELAGYAEGDTNLRRFAQTSVYTGPLKLVLAPNTAVVFDLVVDVAGRVTPGEGRGEAYHSVVGLILQMGGINMEDHWRYMAESSSFSGEPASFDVIEHFTVSHENRTDAAASGYVQFYTWSYAASSAPAAIPEPGQLPMLAAGLAILGLWGGRKRPA